MTVFLVNGVMLQGEVLAFNRFSMLLGRRGQLQLIYKHAVSTMQPGRQLSLGNGDDEEGAA
jgi:host factor-I protein